MATNYIQEGRRLYLDITGKSSGDPVCVGQITGVALEDADSGNKGTVETQGVFDLSVEANDGGASAVVIGDAIYCNVADTPKLNKKVAGVLFGYALEGINAGATDTINVKLK